VTRYLLALIFLTVSLAPAVGQEKAAESKSLLSLEAVDVQPSQPGADTLCRLQVKIRNRGDKIASSLAFRVKLNQQELGVYLNQLFMEAIHPGEVADIKLYNFWTTETSRPYPKGGKMRVEVSLTESRWTKVETDEEGVQVWTPIGDVEGLPVSNSITLQLKPQG
jgi:hypothetical protein